MEFRTEEQGIQKEEVLPSSFPVRYSELIFQANNMGLLEVVKEKELGISKTLSNDGAEFRASGEATQGPRRLGRAKRD